MSSLTSTLSSADRPGTVTVDTLLPAVSVSGLEKSYGAIHALKGVDLDIVSGEVHGLVGANGAGKSTLVRSLAGLEQPDAGVILVGGDSVSISSPAAATRLGLAFIHQELNLVESFTASQNIMLGSHKGRALVRRGLDGVHLAAQQAARQIGIDFKLDKPVSQLTVHQKWLVSIARALVHDCTVIVMDEPTASLDADESRRLLDVARGLAADGVAVVFISHRLDEVLWLCDRVTAFRDGRVSARIDRAELTRPALVEAIVGRAVAENPEPHDSTREIHASAPTALTVRGARRGRMLENVDLDLREGELLGIAGLVGSGRTELLRVIFGADRLESGTMTVFGVPHAPRSIADGIRHGLAFVSEERRAEALFLDLPVSSNLHITTWRKWRHRGLPLISTRKAESAAKKTTEQLGVVLREGGVRQKIGGLSGGNQQKVVIGRWLQTGPRILLLDEPTRGVDIGARTEIYARIREIARSGMSVIVVSSELEELLECDRVVVMSAGRTVGELEGEAISVNDMLQLCYR